MTLHLSFHDPLKQTNTNCMSHLMMAHYYQPCPYCITVMGAIEAITLGFLLHLPQVSSPAKHTGVNHK